MAFEDTNKAEPHLVALPKRTRTELKAYRLARIYKNDNKEITAEMVGEVVDALIDAMPNLLDDNLDLRAYKTETFALADCDLAGGVYTYTLEHEAVNPADDSSFAWEGIACDYGTEYNISGTALTFSLDADVTVTADLEFTIKYRYFL
jgi:hypothetical protein